MELLYSTLMYYSVEWKGDRSIINWKEMEERGRGLI
jgi:hypothetical protein